jgi:hypothetical protein
MRVRRLLSAMLLLSFSRVVVAQQIAPAAVAHRASPDSLNQRLSPAAAFGTRSLTGALGFVVGVGAGLGLADATGPHSCGGCDDPGLGEAIAGAALGGVLGAALGASIPKVRTKCGAGERFVRATVGSLAGTVAGAVVASNAGLIVAWPLGAVLGSSVALIGC